MDGDVAQRQGGFVGTTCRYGSSAMDMRGPAVALDDPYSVVLGGSAVHGAEEAVPFVARLATATGRRIANLGVRNAGLDVFARDEALLAVAAGAEVAVLQTLGAHGLSNRFYKVHPRRNDRFLRQSERLAALYPEVDFSEFAFVRHLLVTLHARCPARFEEVLGELRLAWVARMRQMTDALPGRRILLDIRSAGRSCLGPDPLFVTGDMIGQLRETVDEVVTVDLPAHPSPLGPPDHLKAAAIDGAAHPPAASDMDDAICAALVPAVGFPNGRAA